MAASVIRFINMKGGVGKTTLCVGVADFLATNFDKSILVIDIDPQFNATQSILNKHNLIDSYLTELKPNKKTIRKIFEIPTTIMQQAMTPKKDEVITKISKNMDMILGDLDIIFDTGDVQIRVGKVKKFIEENNLKDEYDYILIDSPPTISLFTDAALLASDYYLVPVKIDQYSILGATSLISVVKNLEYNFTHKINQLGFIYTNTDENMTDKTRRIKDEFENIKENHHIDDDLYFFSSQFSYVRDLMVGVRGNIASNYTKSRNDINAICHELIERLDVLERSDESE